MFLSNEAGNNRLCFPYRRNIRGHGTLYFQPNMIFLHKYTLNAPHTVWLESYHDHYCETISEIGAVFQIEYSS